MNPGQFEVGPTIRHTILPGTGNLVTLTTIPNAICIIRPEGSENPTNALKLFSDPEGHVRFYAHPSFRSDDPAKLTLECQNHEKSVRHSLEFRSSFEQVEAFPMVHAIERKTKGRIVPALSGREMLSLTDEELKQRGYPRRPNRLEIPKAYESWERLVSIPIELVEASVIPHPDVRHGLSLTQGGVGDSNTYNWSGFVLQRPIVGIKLLTGGISAPVFDEPYDWV
jgi:hypothetical protein